MHRKAYLRALLPLALLFPGGRVAAQALPAARAASVASQRVNLAHFDHLFAEAVVGGETVGILNIYSEAPDYRFAIEPREGYACVDDVARGLVLLAAIPNPNPARLRQLDLMARFVVRMQADNGYFHNFIWAGGRINREYRTSLAELNWWSLRALWGLEAALPHLPPATAMRARAAADRLVANLERDLPLSAPGTRVVEGVTVPTWLPLESGADAGSTALLGLMAQYRRTQDAATRALIVRIGEGLVMMQAGDARRFPHGAHLSWRNQWHGWGNAQAYALLRAGTLLGRRDFVDSGLREVDLFYPWLLRTGMRASFVVQAGRDGFVAGETAPFPQIAYGIGPMVLAANEAFVVTRKSRYRTLAGRLAGWFAGANAAGQPMYDPASGRAFDGIVRPGEVNRNSGAESTVETLLALTAMQGTTLP